LKICRDESHILLRYRSLLACFFGILLVPFFSILDYFAARDLWYSFLTLRILNTVESAIILALVYFHPNLEHRYLNVLMTIYFSSVALMISYMCHQLGGYGSPYYAGLNLVILVIALIMPWKSAITAANGAIIYLTFVIVAHRTNSTLDEWLNSSCFLITFIAVSILGSSWNQSLRDKERESRQKLSELSCVKSTFFENVAHELKTPVTLVVTSLEHILDKTAADSPSVLIQRPLFETIRSGARRLAERVDELVDLAKMEASKVSLKITEIADPQLFFWDIFRCHLPLFEKRGLEGIFIGGHGGTLAPHRFDKEKIDKVVTNLLSNAIKFTPHGGQIVMSVWDEPHTSDRSLDLKLCIKDTGIGIPEVKLPHIFERFMQVDPSSTRSTPGMGIGLSLVEEFVALHGGEIHAISTVGHGSSFTVVLPRYVHNATIVSRS